MGCGRSDIMQVAQIAVAVSVVGMVEAVAICVCVVVRPPRRLCVCVAVSSCRPVSVRVHHIVCVPRVWLALSDSSVCVRGAGRSLEPVVAVASA